MKSILSFLFFYFSLISMAQNQLDIATLRLRLLGKYDPQNDTNFIKIDSKLTDKTDIYLQKEAYNAFLAMHQAAKNDNIELTIISATRNFYKQAEIWNNKWTGKQLVNGQKATKIKNLQQRATKILAYSAMPGTSRHHWGTDIDINSVDDEYFNTPIGKKTYEWLTKNAYKYGFCQVYTPYDEFRKTGYKEEKWHWSYVPISASYTSWYQKLITYEDIKGFEGDAIAKKIDVIKNYVLAINPKCLEQ